MFLNHFALTTHPFAEKPPIEWLLRDEHIDQALARLKFFEQQNPRCSDFLSTNCHKTAIIQSICISPH